MISFECTYCQARLKVSPDKAGKKGKCPKCGRELAVPAPPGAEQLPTLPPRAGPAAQAFFTPGPILRHEQGYVHLIPASGNSTSSLFQAEPGLSWHALMGGTIPFIPDFNRPGSSESDRRQLAIEVLNRQISFIQTLCTHKEATFALRFVSHPESHRIDLHLFAKCVSDSRDNAEQAVRRAWRTVEGTFPRGYPLETIKAADAFTDCFQPFAYNDVVEIRRPESLIGQEAYVVYPLAWGLNAMVHLCTALVRARGQYLVSICLRPTALSENEREAVNWMASRLRESADYEFRGFTGTQRVVDESARMAADLYAMMLRELGDPLIMKIHVAGAQEIPEALVAALGTEMTQPSESVLTEQEQQLLRDQHFSSFYDAVRPANPQEMLLARREVYLLETYGWGTTRAPQALGRLRYLVDSRKANCAFRLPVAPSDRIDGIVVQPYSPFSRSHGGADASQPSIPLGTFIHRGLRESDGPRLPLGQLTRHALIAGFTGSGKTTTCMHILTELWTRHRIPWLVLEPAKGEYRQLCCMAGLRDDLHVFTLGNEESSPFRLNPLEPVPGYPLQAHIDYLRSAIFASIPMWEPLPRIVERSLHEVFRGRQYDGVSPMDNPPTLKDLAAQIQPVVEKLGYDAQVRDRCIGALRAAFLWTRWSSARPSSSCAGSPTKKSAP